MSHEANSNIASISHWPRPNLPQGAPCRHIRVGPHEWTVCEDPGDGVLRRHALVYFGPGIVRRVRAFPSNWLVLSDEQLYSLSWGR